MKQQDHLGSPAFPDRVGPRLARMGFLRCLGALCMALLDPGAAVAHEGHVAGLARMDEALAASPGNPVLLLQRGELYVAGQHWKMALADAEAVRQTDPGRVEALWLKARALDGDGQLEEALASTEAYIRQHPEHFKARALKARLLFRLKRYPDALSILEQALSMKPQRFPDWEVQRARYRVAADPGALNQALQGLEDAMKELGPLVSLQVEAARLEAQAGRFRNAEKRLDTLINTYGKTPQWEELRVEWARAESGRYP